MNYKDNTKIIYGERALCAHLVQTYNEASPEEDTARITTLCQRFGIEIGYVEPPPLPLTIEETAHHINQTINSICYSINTWVDGELNAAGVMMVDRILRLEPANEKALATDNWVRAEYYEAEVRKYYVQMGVWTADFDPADFSMRVKKPYLVSSLDIEYRRLYPAPPYLP